MKIDTEIRHATKPGANLFLELGFAPAEAKRLRAASRKQINDTQLLKQQLMDELSTWVESGLPLHDGKTACEFCGGDLDAHRMASIKAHFSKDLANHK